MKLTLKITFVVSCFVFLAFIAGCSENPAAPDTGDTGLDNAEMESAGHAGVLLYGLVNDAQDANELMRGQNGMPNTGLNNQLLMNAGGDMARGLTAPMVAYHAGNPGRLYKVMGREVVWEMRWTDEQTGALHHAVLEYDSDNGHAYGYEVITQNPQGDVVYDSSAVEIDANFTLQDSTDDVLVSFQQLLQYKSGYHIASEFSSVDFDDYAAGSEPGGGFVKKETTYAAGQDMVRMIETMESHEPDVGVWEKRIEYSNGQEHYERVDFVKGGGTFEEILRDGTRAAGSFDTPEDDNIGHCTKTTTYPAGHDPKSVQEEWEAVFDPADSTMDASFTKTTIFADGRTVTEQFKVDEFVQNGYRGQKISTDNTDGTGGEITVIDTDNGQDVDGWWIEKDGQYIVVDGSFYRDGSARLDLTVYASRTAFENGEEPVFTGQFFFNPDGSGKGELVADNEVYKFDIGPDGSTIISS